MHTTKCWFIYAAFKCNVDGSRRRRRSSNVKLPKSEASEITVAAVVAVVVCVVANV